MMHGPGESHASVVSTKSPNNADEAAEGMEKREATKRNLREQNKLRAQDRANLQSALERVRQQARKDKRLRFTTLFHHVYAIGTLRTAYFDLKRDAAAGVDEETWQHYGENLEDNLQALSQKLKRGAYRARPVRRVYIPKADGHQRPLGINTLEDKVVQRATVEVLNAIYEVDFMGFSYGFRPKRNQHRALDALWMALLRKKVSWVLDADIRGYFDAIDHGWLIKFLEHRIADKRIIRLIRKWLNAGVLEDGSVQYAKEGAPQGGSASPLLANVFLHYVFDLWVHQWRKRQAPHHDVIVVRFADDTVVGFEHKLHADRFLAELKERFQKFKLELHPDKTRLLEFGRFAARRRKGCGLGRPETFDFLGFTHICGTKRDGRFTVLRHTIRKRLVRKLADVKQELRLRMHSPIPEMGNWLGDVLRGHYQYYAVPTNYKALSSFRYHVGRLWQHALGRRGQRSHVSWDRMDRLMARWLPPPRIVHPYPYQRLVVTTQGRSRMP